MVCAAALLYSSFFLNGSLVAPRQMSVAGTSAGHDQKAAAENADAASLSDISDLDSESHPDYDDSEALLLPVH